MAETGVELPPEEAPIIQESNLTTAPTDTTQDIYQNEFGRLVAPTNQQAVRDEHMFLSRHFGLFNSWDERDSDQGGGGGLLGRQYKFADMNRELDKAGAKKLTLQETQKIYPDAVEPMHEQYAMALANQKRLVEGRREYAARGGDVWWTTHLGQELFRAFTEPSELALMAATSGASTLAGVGNSVRAVFLSNLAQNLAVEAASYPELKNEGENPTLAGSLTNAAVGTTIGTGFHFGLQAVAQKIKAELKARRGDAAPAPADKAPSEKAPAKPPEGGPPPPPDGSVDLGPQNTPPVPPHDRPTVLPKHPLPAVPPDVEMTRFLTAIAQHENWRAINPSGVGEDVLHARALGAPIPGSTKLQHVYTPFTDGTDRHFFMSGADGEAFAASGLGGKVAFDGLDNGHATNMNGSLAEYRLREKGNFIDLDQRGTALPNVLDVVSKHVLERLSGLMSPAEREKLGTKLEFPVEATLKDILENVKYQTPDALDDIANDLSKMGIDGYHYTTVDAQGQPVHNGFVVFDEKKLDLVGQYDQNVDMIPKVDPAEVNAAVTNDNPYESSPFYEAGVTEAPAEKIPAPLDYAADPDAFNSAKSQELRTQGSEHERALKQAMEAAPETAGEIEKELAAIDKEFEESTKRAKAMKLLGDCLGGTS